MIVLGINQIPLFSVTHDCAAAIVKNGEIIAAVEEERFNRIKHTAAPPQEAMRFCLETAGISLSDLDLIAFANDPYRLFANLHRDFHYRTVINKALRFLGAQRCRYDMWRVSKVPVCFIGHHRAHAACGYFLSGFDEANILVADGAGESETFTFYVARENRITRIWSIPLGWRYSNSIGAMYSQLTRDLSLGRFGEGKTMGLAAYGKPSIDLADCFSVSGHRKYKLDRWRLTEIYNEIDRESIDERFCAGEKNLAASVQKALEDSLINLAQEAWRRTRIKKFVLAGGVALNCNLNSKLLNQDFCDALFVPPNANDGGLAVGAALYATSSRMKFSPTKLPNPYLGPSFEDQDIEKVLSRENVTWNKCSAIEREAASAICSGKVVGWVQGRVEIGPRALGNRSILADPTRPGMKDRLNSKIKKREQWRPFGPAVALDAASRYFLGFEKLNESPYMLHTVTVREQFRRVFPAITHVDGSTRPQTVCADQNPRFYALLREVEQLNGHPMVVNTSFNMDREPMVCSPEDALRCFLASELDVFVIGDYIANKN